MIFAPQKIFPEVNGHCFCQNLDLRSFNNQVSQILPPDSEIPANDTPPLPWCPTALPFHENPQQLLLSMTTSQGSSFFWLQEFFQDSVF